MELHEIIRRLRVRSEKRTAERVLRQLGVTGDAFRLLLPLVQDEVGRVNRNRTRNTEKRAFPKTRRKFHKRAEQESPLTARQKLLREEFALEDGRRVLWGEATVEDHEARIAFLTKKVGGLTDTIRRHEQAIAEIEAAGVECLNEIEVEEVA